MKSSLGGASIREQLQKTLIDYSLVRYPNENDEATLLDELVALIESITNEVIGKNDDQKRGGPLYKEPRNKLRAEQRERLAQLLGDKK